MINIIDVLNGSNSCCVPTRRGVTGIQRACFDLLSSSSRFVPSMYKNTSCLFTWWESLSSNAHDWALEDIKQHAWWQKRRHCTFKSKGESEKFSASQLCLLFPNGNLNCPYVSMQRGQFPSHVGSIINWCNSSDAGYQTDELDRPWEKEWTERPNSVQFVLGLVFDLFHFSSAHKCVLYICCHQWFTL